MKIQQEGERDSRPLSDTDRGRVLSGLQCSATLFNFRVEEAQK